MTKYLSGFYSAGRFALVPQDQSVQEFVEAPPQEFVEVPLPSPFVISCIEDVNVRHHDVSWPKPEVILQNCKFFRQIFVFF